MIQKTFLPKDIPLDEKALAQLRKNFSFLTDDDIELIKQWNDIASPYTGTIIDEKGNPYACYPYDKDGQHFLQEYPEQRLFAKEDDVRKVLCKQCREYPGWVKVVDSGGPVYWALECGCKTTPYSRGQSGQEGTWNSTTWALTPKEAFDIAEKESLPVQVRRPAHAM